MELPNWQHPLFSASLPGGGGAALTPGTHGTTAPSAVSSAGAACALALRPSGSGKNRGFPVPSCIPAGSAVPGEAVPPHVPTAPRRCARPCPCPPRGDSCGRARTGADPRTPLFFLRRAAAVTGDLLRLQHSPSPVIWGSLLCLLMRPRAPTGPSLSHVPARRCPAPDTVPGPRDAAGGGKGCFVLPSAGSLRRPLRTPCKLIPAAQRYSVLIHIGFSFHKLPNCSCFWGQCGFVPDCGVHKCSGDFLLCAFLSVRRRHEPINVRFIIQHLLGERSP